jgi:hypothetical protein
MIGGANHVRASITNLFGERRVSAVEVQMVRENDDCMLLSRIIFSMQNEHGARGRPWPSLQSEPTARTSCITHDGS